MEKKIDIFKVLNEIDSGNIHYYSTLTPEEKKSLSMYVLFNWMCGTDNEVQIKGLDLFVNPYLFSLSKHDELLFKLLVIASSGTQKQYKWKAKKKEKSKSLISKIISEYHSISMKDAEKYKDTFDKEVIIDMAKDLGYDDSELKKIEKQYV